MSVGQGEHLSPSHARLDADHEIFKQVLVPVFLGEREVGEIGDPRHQPECVADHDLQRARGRVPTGVHDSPIDQAVDGLLAGADINPRGVCPVFGVNGGQAFCIERGKIGVEIHAFLQVLADGEAGVDIVAAQEVSPCGFGARAELIEAEPIADKGRSQNDYGHDADGGQTRGVPAGIEQVADFFAFVYAAIVPRQGIGRRSRHGVGLPDAVDVVICGVVPGIQDFVAPG